jgi:hypothetical protein
MAYMQHNYGILRMSDDELLLFNMVFGIHNYSDSIIKNLSVMYSCFF